MLLAIDIGNTNITLGLYEGETLGPRWRLATAHERMPDEYGLQLVGLFNHAGIKTSDVTAIAMASVVPPLTGVWAQACQAYINRDPLIVEGPDPGGRRRDLVVDVEVDDRGHRQIRICFTTRRRAASRGAVPAPSSMAW